jgi:hypothetical protein
MDAWLDSVEQQLDSLLAQVKWNKLKLLSADIALPAASSLETKEPGSDVSDHAKVYYNTRYVPAAVAVKYKTSNNSNNEPDQAGPLQVTLPRDDLRNLLRQYNKHKSNRNQVQPAVDDAPTASSDPRHLLRYESRSL